VNAKHSEKNAFEMKGLRKILRVSWTAKKTNEWVLNKAGVKSIRMTEDRDNFVESASMEYPTFGSRSAKEQNKRQLKTLTVVSISS